MRFLKVLFTAVCLSGVVSSASALKIEITQGQVKATPIAITNFYAPAANDASKKGEELAKIITYDLKTSGLFEPLNPAAFVQDSASLQQSPRFADWRILNAQCLLCGKVEESGGQIKVQFRLFDVFKGEQLLGLELKVESSKWRRLAHMIADEIYKRITGEEGYFNTKLAFIDESGPKGKRRVRRLSIMDYDGADVQHLTNGSSIVLTPRYAPNNQQIAYLSYEEGAPQVFLYDLPSNSKKHLHTFAGYNMSFAPRFSPDSTEIVMSLQKGGSSAIYLMNIATKKLTNLTQHDAVTSTSSHHIDTSPCFSPDGSQIVFTSDRGGIENIYIMGRDGSNPHRVSFGGGKYSQPVWSPRGDLIAFTKMQGGVFYIGVMRPDGSDERLITSGYLVEAPIWSANGRVLMYAKEERKGRAQLYAIDLTGRYEHKIKTPREASDGAWSQLLNRSEMSSNAGSKKTPVPAAPNRPAPAPAAPAPTAAAAA